MADLLPCPFCGGKAERIDIEDGDNVGGSCVTCTTCNASGNVEFGFKENFVSNWNRRAPVADWQPIETAPVDLNVLLYCPNLGVANPERIELGPAHTSRGSHHSWATMWMPLPAAPVDGGEDA